MKKGWLLCVFLVGGTMLLSACTTRTTDLPGPPLIPVDQPTQAPVQPTQAPVQPTQVPAQPTQASAPETPVEAPDLTQFPEMTVLGTWESGIPFGVTADGHAFKGDPNAAVMITEYSEYQ